MQQTVVAVSSESAPIYMFFVTLSVQTKLLQSPFPVTYNSS